MNPARRPWFAILSSLVLGLLIAASTPFVAAVTVYVTSPPPAEPDPTFLGIFAGITLGPSILLGIAARRARLVSAHWDLGTVGGHILMFVSLLLAAFLGVCGLYAVFHLVKVFGTQ